MYLLSEFKGKKGRSGRKKGNFITGDPTNKKNRKIGRAIGTGLGVVLGTLAAKKAGYGWKGSTVIALGTSLSGREVGDTLTNRKLNIKEKVGNTILGATSLGATSYRLGGKRRLKNSDNSLIDNIKSGSNIIKRLT